MLGDSIHWKQIRIKRYLRKATNKIIDANTYSIIWAHVYRTTMGMVSNLSAYIYEDVLVYVEEMQNVGNTA